MESRKQNPQFEVQESIYLSYKEIKLINKISGEYITVLPQLGARLNEAVINNKSVGYSIIRKLESQDLSCRDNLFNNVKLFPFASRLEGGRYMFEGKSYQLEKNYPEENNACHGFVYNKEFEFDMSNTSEEFGELSFSYNYQGDIEGYPFTFRLSLIYRLFSDGKIECITRLKNLSGGKILFTDGWHHYFTLGNCIDDLEIEMQAEKYKMLNEFGIPQSIEKALSKEELNINLKNKLLDNVFVFSKQSAILTKLKDPKKNIALVVWQEGNENKYLYQNVYTPPDRKSIAIEPMTSNINAFNNGENLIVIESSECWSSVMGMYIE